MHLFIYLFIFIERCAAGCKNVDCSEKWKGCETAVMSKTKKYTEKLKVIFSNDLGSFLMLIVHFL